MYQYRTTILSIGQYAQEALADNMMVLFGEDAPEDIKEYCFVHSQDRLKSELDLNSTLLIGDCAYIVTSVGNVANHNLRELGHVTLKFDGQKTPELPGTIHLIGPEVPSVVIGDELIFG